MKHTLAWSVPLMILTLASATLGQDRAPSLEGKWVGTAEVTTCSANAGSLEVVLRLDDKGYNPPPHVKNAATIGNVSGPVEIDGKTDGIIALNFVPGSGVFESAIGTQRTARPSGGLAQSNDSAFSSYWIKLKPGDALLGFGKYQSLEGTLSRPDSRCSQLQNGGQVLRVKLKKQ